RAAAGGAGGGAGGAAVAGGGGVTGVDRRTAGEEPVSERRTAVVGEGGEPRVDAGPIGAGEPARPVAVEVVGVAHRDEAADGAAGAVAEEVAGHDRVPEHQRHGSARLDTGGVSG